MSRVFNKDVTMDLIDETRSNVVDVRKISIKLTPNTKKNNLLVHVVIK